MKDFFEVTCETDNEQEALVATAKHLKEILQTMSDLEEKIKELENKVADLEHKLQSQPTIEDIAEEISNRLCRAVDDIPSKP